jgi:hypothetical protein
VAHRVEFDNNFKGKFNGGSVVDMSSISISHFRSRLPDSRQEKKAKSVPAQKNGVIPK